MAIVLVAAVPTAEDLDPGPQPTLSCLEAHQVGDLIALSCRLTNNAGGSVLFDARTRAMPSLDVERFLDGTWKPLATDLDPDRSIVLELHEWESLKFKFSVPRVAEPLRVTATWRTGKTRRPVQSNIGRLVDDTEAAGGASDVPRWCCLDLEPVQIVSRVEPKWPWDARWNQRQGMILVELVVEADGSAKIVRMLKGDQTFDKQVIEATQGWKFKPARDAHGQPVRTYFFIQFEFRLRS
ncbi:MAG TPA: energy transducer TonB [Candidatus Polarisedimenticolaceae bacterium]|nr:energy transducer TonB [Candidatus Polarisedimenticolaceae bacterium]